MSGLHEGDPLASPLAAPPRPHYDGSGGALASLTWRTTLLTLVSLGLYRFWARTRIRRYL